MTALKTKSSSNFLEIDKFPTMHFKSTKIVPAGKDHYKVTGVTLLAGVVLAITGGALADRAGINGVIFGATFLALATALPEISTGIAAVRLGDHQLAKATSSGATPSSCVYSCWPT